MGFFPRFAASLGFDAHVLMSALALTVRCLVSERSVIPPLMPSGTSITSTVNLHSRDESATASRYGVQIFSLLFSLHKCCVPCLHLRYVGLFWSFSILTCLAVSPSLLVELSGPLPPPLVFLCECERHTVLPVVIKPLGQQEVNLGSNPHSVSANDSLQSSVIQPPPLAVRVLFGYTSPSG